MTRYIIRRLLQAIPLLFIISLVLFILMQNMGDPLATMGGRKVTRKEDRIRLDTPAWVWINRSSSSISTGWSATTGRRRIWMGMASPRPLEAQRRAARRLGHFAGQPQTGHTR